jgi:hypothetical protein
MQQQRNMARWPAQTLARGALQVAQRVAAVLNRALGKLDGDVALDFELVGVEGNVATGVIGLGGLGKTLNPKPSKP